MSRDVRVDTRGRALYEEMVHPGQQRMYSRGNAIRRQLLPETLRGRNAEQKDTDETHEENAFHGAEHRPADTVDGIEDGDAHNLLKHESDEVKHEHDDEKNDRREEE